jgi:hypothetical protein
VFCGILPVFKALPLIPIPSVVFFCHTFCKPTLMLHIAFWVLLFLSFLKVKPKIQRAALTLKSKKSLHSNHHHRSACARKKTTPSYFT